VAEAVLDASALLAYFNDEPGGDVVEEALTRLSVVSAVNWAEVLTKVSETGQSPADFCAEITQQGILGQLLDVVTFEQTGAAATAALRDATRERGLSLGDRACLALGRQLGLPVYTSDRVWSELPLDLEIRVIR
jgi:PIN domain nuclease of toxin-antitoxin system